ncbi:MAG: addiction module toxin RelE [Alkaliphilus sp.]|nr:type II toxin-antitoxin system RelE/ParE family toxin [bacterium AH-315-L21]MBN4056571.1 type II toxin-antitoxin system RelE/ParE family toxin [bacterium AH-315-K05]MBN4069637.1 type II toxin-antitoxin system RelE/ParE family toxin [bacterium AH-315-G05]MBN4074294.1 type II toxin-antitoxin system RelE/ParE family toxin [bacterium AH-315-E09]PHS31795.1 MAG: addiction module toxin RelE [Alkaliphilus sp.]
MKKYNVKFLKPALDDLEEIVLYIAQDSPPMALKMYDNIIACSMKLETFPKLGRKVPDKKMNESGFRMLVLAPYIAFYRVINDTVYIYRVLHGARSYPLLYTDWVIER